jgi:hypothetical protein
MVFHMILTAAGVGHSAIVHVMSDGHELLAHMDRRLFVK